MRTRSAAALLTVVALMTSMVPGAQAAVLDPPTVSSAEYPDDFDSHDGVGRYGTFVIDDPGDLALHYDISFNSEPVRTVDTTNGAPVTVLYLPTRSGPNRVTVQSVTEGNVRSAPTDYSFAVNIGTAAKAQWKLDEPAGTPTLQAVTRENEPEIAADPRGGVTLGVDGQAGTAMSLDGSTGHAATTGPIVDTTQSFSVSSWVRPTTSADGTVVSQVGYKATAYALSASSGHWVFRRSLSDKATAKSARVVSDQELQVGEWNHLVGVYDATVNKLSLYVNGDLAGETSLTAPPWSAHGPFRIGAGSAAGGNPADFLQGEFDEVRVFDRIVVADEVKELFRQEPIRAARWKLNVDGTDDTGHGHGLTLQGGATIDPDSGFFWGMSPAGLLLNGTDGYAETAAPVVRTDLSFTMTAWAFSTSRPTEKATVLAQSGANGNRFVLGYQPGEDPATQGRWQLEMADADSATSRISTVTHSTYSEGSWDHLALVYDAYHDTMTLYVNGQPEINEQNTSIKTGVLGFDAGNGGLQIGRSKIGDPEYWPGAIDDVWLFEGVLSPEQIGMLAAPGEIDTEHGPGQAG
ncbi:MAG: LamG domain-containing protein [Actinomadura sp.]